MKYTRPDALPVALSAQIDELRAHNPEAGDLVARIGLLLYRCGHVDGFKAAAQSITSEIISQIDSKLAEIKGLDRG